MIYKLRNSDIRLTMTRKPKVSDSEKLRLLRELVREAETAYPGARTLSLGGAVAPMPPVVLVSDLVAAGIVPRPRKRKAKR